MIRQLTYKNCLFLSVITIFGCFYTKEAQLWQLEPEGVTSFSLSRDGRFALLASHLQGITVWDLSEYKKLADFGYQDPQHNTVLTSRISDNNQYAITATSQNFAVWNLALGKADGLWSISDGLIRDVDISNNGQKVILALSNKKALYIDLGTGKRLEFLAHQEKVNSVAISANGNYVLSGGNDQNAYLWDTQTGQIVHKFSHPARVSQVALHRSGVYAFTGDSESNAFIWRLKTGEKQSKLASFRRFTNYTSARFSDDGKYLLAGMPSGIVEFWLTQHGTKLDSWNTTGQSDAYPPVAIVYDVAFDSLGRVVAGTSAGVAQAWYPNKESNNGQ